MEIAAQLTVISGASLCCYFSSSLDLPLISMLQQHILMSLAIFSQDLVSLATGTGQGVGTLLYWVSFDRVSFPFLQP